ncbi:hypothetical protein D9756_004341 [Leucocoprinus leucothites]|uniref:Protein kinase domain-containing protein n=1 Tax=Leucocoprinus leucothites TaxID=201217 RepID=A0A8H5D9V5_9AGAR|nr:hypothetical protein D9756_004341 [Leucoagaricus leucothites]
MFFSHLPNHPLPKSPPFSKPLLAPRLEIPPFDSLSFSHIFSGMLESEDHSTEATGNQSSVDMLYVAQQYTNIKDVTAEWEDDQNEHGPLLEHSLPNIPTFRIQPVQTPGSDQSRSSTTSSPCKRSSRDDVPPLSDFLINPMAFDAGVGVCVRRSDGRLYAIKKQSQTRQAWLELDILLKIKEARIPFSPLLHWTYERDQHVYLIMENYPTGTLADAIGHYGIFGSLEVFFYASELLIGLQFLHNIDIVHRNISPETIIFDRKGHLILSGLEGAAVLRPREKCLFDICGHNDIDRHYQAPEILLGWCHDELVDSWSFGMVLYYMFHGKHAFLDETENSKKYLSKDLNKIILEGLPQKAIRSINPVARDLILKCLEHNPAMRATIQDVQRHTYFSSADWESVSKQRAIAPLPREFLSTNVLRPPALSGDPDVSHEQCFSPRLGTLNPEYSRHTFGQVAPQFLRSPFVTPRKGCGAPAVIDQPMAQSTMILDKETRVSISEIVGNPHAITVSPAPNMTHALIEDSHVRMADFWNSIDREDQLSTHSGYSALSNIKMPFSRAWNLRKERSLMFHPHQLFSLSSTSIQHKLKKRPKSVATLKYAAYAEPIGDLPSGLSQIGSGIGFTFTGPSVPPLPGPTPSQTVASKPSELSCSSSDPDACPLPDRSRNSMSSDFTVAVPNACHGLFRSLRMTSFWAGFKSGSARVPIAVVSPLRPSTCPEKTSGEREESLDSPIRMSFPGLYAQHLEQKGDCLPEISQPLAESTAFFSGVPEALSPTTLLSSPTTSTSTISEEEVLTPETVDFHSETVVLRSSEEEIVERKRSEEAYHFGPESTLRLVTPRNGLRLALAGGPYPS